MLEDKLELALGSQRKEVKVLTIKQWERYEEKPIKQTRNLLNNLDNIKF